VLDTNQRADRYRAQTSRAALTARQMRRLNHKFNHRSQEAVARRDGAARIADRSMRASARTAR
jgi:hypothetical protein